MHGPNLNLLGRREPQIYGTTTLDQINARLAALAKEIDVDLVTVQSNQEGAIVDAFQAHMDDVDGAIINAAGLEFQQRVDSRRDQGRAVSGHRSAHFQPGTRDDIHRHSILTPAVRGSVMGLGWRSYTAALRSLVEIVREAKAGARPSLTPGDALLSRPHHDNLGLRPTGETFGRAALDAGQRKRE